MIYTFPERYEDIRARRRYGGEAPKHTLWWLLHHPRFVFNRLQDWWVIHRERRDVVRSLWAELPAATQQMIDFVLSGAPRYNTNHTMTQEHLRVVRARQNIVWALRAYGVPERILTAESKEFCARLNEAWKTEVTK